MPKKTDEYRVFAAEILIGQIKEGRIACFELFDNRTQTFVTSDKEDIIIAVSAFQDLLVQGFVFLCE